MEKIIVTTQEELQNLIEVSVNKAIKRNSNPPVEKAEDKIFGIQEASEYLQIAIQTIYGLTCRRKIPYLKRGKKLYFRKNDLENWLNLGRKNTQEEIEAEVSKRKKKGGSHE